jgi:hypothetical protein
MDTGRGLIFADTNILIDIANGNPAWAGWSRHAIASGHARGLFLFGQGAGQPSKSFPRKIDISLPVRRTCGLIDPHRSGERTAAPGEKGKIRNFVRISLVTH